MDFRRAVDHNITVVIWSEYENLYEIDQFGGILYLSTARSWSLWLSVIRCLTS